MSQEIKEVMSEYLRITAEAAGFSNPESLPEIIGALIGTFLSLLGVIFLILVIYGGFLWMTSGGNEQKIYKAKQTLQRSIIGFIIIMSSYAITFFVFDAMKGALN